MAKHIRVMLEIGPKGKRIAAVAPDWPGLERGAKTAEAAVERLLSYVPRYAAVAKLAGMEAAFAKITAVEDIERYLHRLNRFLGYFLRIFDHDHEPVG